MKRLIGVFLLALVTTFSHSAMAQLQVSLPDTVVGTDETSLLVPITIEGLSGDSISGFTFKVGFDPSIVSVSGFSKSSTLSSSFQVNGNGDTSESYIVSGAGSTPIYDDGVIIYLDVLVNSVGSSTLEFLNVEINEGQPSFTSNNGSVTVGSKPDTPILTSPADGASDVELTPTLQWDELEAANSYDVQLSGSSNFETLITEESVTNGTLAIEGLDYLTEYFWRVRAVNDQGNSDWSATFSFTTVQIEAPAIPALSSPDDGAVKVAVNPTIEWNSAERASSYEFQVSSDSGFSSLDSDGSITDTSKQLGGLSYNTQYFWRVRAVNEGGNSDWSSTRSFTTIIEAPAIPELNSPENGAEEISINPELSWGGSERAESYILQVSQTDDFSSPLLDENITGTTKLLENLEHLTQYYWRVKAVNEGGESDWSTIFAFTTIIEIPGISDLIFPVDEANDVDTLVTLVWSEAERAASYQVQLSEVSDFSSTLRDEELADTVWSVGNLAFSTTYFWRVRAKNAAGEGNWSTTNEFTTGDAEAGTPSLVSPVNNETGTDTSLTFTWNASENAIEYEIQVSQNVDFTSVVKQNNSVTDTVITFDGFEFESRYFWRVRAFAQNTTSGWSSTFNFTTIEKENEPPKVVAPMGSIELDEDFGSQAIAELNTVFADPEEGVLTFEVLQVLNAVEANISDGSLILSSKENQFGTGEVIIQATDEEGATANDTLKVEIKSVNDIPYFVEIPDTLKFVSGEEYTFEFGDLILDVEDDLTDLSYSFNVEPDDIEISFSISDVSITIVASNFVGEGLLTFEITDSDGGVLEESIVLVIESGTSVEGDELIPNEFSLSQNYPNPFNPTTRIEYQLPKASSVSFQVFDMTGREVYSEISQQKSAGTHAINFDASTLSSGIYIYRLRAAEYAQTKKMTLIK